MRPGLAFLLAFVVLFPATLRRDLWSPDEQRHAEVGRTMLATGDWVLPHLERTIYPDKPAPPFWAIGGAMRLFGTTEWAARLPFVLAAGGTLAALAGIARLLGLSGPTTLLTALMLLTSYRFAWLGQRVSLDVMLTCFSTLAIVGWVRQARGIGRDLANGALFFGAAALAVAAKGPLGFLVPVVTAVVHALLTGAGRRLVRPGFLLPAGLFVALTAAWLVPSCLAGGEAYTRELLLEQSAGRVFHAWNHERPPWYYLGKLPLEFMPWTPVALLGLWASLRRRRSRGARAGAPVAGPGVDRLVLAWFGPMFVFLSIVESKRGNYLLPLYPALALYASVTVTRLLGGAAAPLRRVALGLGGLFSLIGVAILVAPFLVEIDGLEAPSLAVGAVTVGAAFLLGAGLCLARARSDRLRPAFVGLAAGMALALPAAGLLVLPEIDALKSPRPVAEALAKEAHGAPLEVPFLDVRTEEYSFYSGLPCREVERDEFRRLLDEPTVRLAVMEAGELKKVELPPGAEVVLRRRVSDDEIVLVRLPRDGT
ncbi:MAG: ArnT family glycosyltransferase [Planctomycetota bacterium JB042]